MPYHRPWHDHNHCAVVAAAAAAAIADGDGDADDDDGHDDYLLTMVHWRYSIAAVAAVQLYICQIGNCDRNWLSH